MSKSFLNSVADPDPDTHKFGPLDPDPLFLCGPDPDPGN